MEQAEALSLQSFVITLYEILQNILQGAVSGRSKLIFSRISVAHCTNHACWQLWGSSWFSSLLAYTIDLCVVECSLCKLFRTSWKVINNLDSHWKLKLQSFQWHRMAVSAESGPKWKVGTHRSSFWNLNRALILTFLLVIKIFSLCSSNKGINFALKSPHAFK